MDSGREIEKKKAGEDIQAYHQHQGWRDVGTEEYNEDKRVHLGF